MAQAEMQLPHKLTLNERKNLKISGVTSVEGFDAETVLLHTTMGSLTVRGQELTLENLSLEGGDVAVTGKIYALFYGEKKEKGGIWHRLLK
jgi:sporulation protein YabP